MTEKQLRAHALRIFKAALKAADPALALRDSVRLRGDRLSVRGKSFDLRRFRRIRVVGAGKAAAVMAQELERLLGKRISGGLINVKYGHTARLRRIELNECAHPVPDESGVRGARRIAELVAGSDEQDLILCVVSGGASALMPMPAGRISLDDKQETTKLLIACGASIHEINTVRKHLSGIKGGQLARLCGAATVISLLLSDVVGDDTDVIGSGPTVPDRSTFADATAVLKRYGIFERVPQSVREHLSSGVRGDIPETPKPGDPLFARVQTAVVASNRVAVAAAAAQARALGYRTLILSTMIEGETKDVARVHAAIAKEILASGHPLKPPACVVSGGETTVTLRGTGRGGRNQEFVLAAAVDIAGLSRTVVLSAGTDGSDGPTDAAGAIADGATLERAVTAGLNANAALEQNDAWPFFDRLGDLIRTGPTGTNVMDVHLVLVGRGPN